MNHQWMDYCKIRYDQLYNTQTTIVAKPVSAVSKKYRFFLAYSLDANEIEKENSAL